MIPKSKISNKLKLVFILNLKSNPVWWHNVYEDNVRRVMIIPWGHQAGKLKKGDVVDFDFMGVGTWQIWPKEAVVRGYKDVTQDRDDYHTFEIYLDVINK